MPEFADRVINCVDCGQSFIHTAGAQEFYAQKGFTSDPKRCPDCRRAKKDKMPGGGGGGGSRPPRTSDNDALLGGGSRGAGGGGGGGGYGGGGGGGGMGSREMFSATCAECGVETQVPFRPRGDRPVYCRECYNSKRKR